MSAGWDAGTRYASSFEGEKVEDKNQAREDECICLKFERLICSPCGCKIQAQNPHEAETKVESIGLTLPVWTLVFSIRCVEGASLPKKRHFEYGARQSWRGDNCIA